jgi:transcriptional regulator with XRE-family HTH domain
MAVSTSFWVDWGARIRARRLELQLSLVQLARQAGVDQGQLSQVERGKGALGEHYKVAVAEALAVDPNELFRFPTADEPQQPATAS